MKKILFISITVVMFITNCKKKNSTSNDDEAYCVYYYNGNTKVFHSCEKTSADGVSKCIQLRDAGKVSPESIKKSTCNDC